MKKLLALVLSIAMVLTMFSGTLGVFAEETATVVTPAAYDGVLPQSTANIFGFEGATIGSNGTYAWDTAHNIVNWEASNRTKYVDYTVGNSQATATIVDDAATGNSALKIDFTHDNTWAALSTREFVELPDDLFSSTVAYAVTAKVKTTDDFNGRLYFRLSTGNHYKAISNNRSWTETYVLDCSAVDDPTKTSIYVPAYKWVTKEPGLLGGWNIVNSSI